MRSKYVRLVHHRTFESLREASIRRTLFSMSRSIVMAALVAFAPAAWADLEPGHVVSRVSEPQRNAARAASDAAELLVHGDANGALDMATRALALNTSDPWAHYVKAVSLARLGRLDDAIAEFRAAELAFPPQERWSRATAIWGRANAFYQVGRCGEAKSSFGDYLKYVGKDDAAGAALAQKGIDGCREPWAPPAK
jgi:tetratricopeptide (TPR) repeat protein